MPKTYTFPFVRRGDLDVLVDVWVPERPKSSAPLPILIWYHGGGLVQGNRKALAAHHRRNIDELGICILSPDYRLTPQIRVPELQDDLVALTQWVEKDLSNGLSSATSAAGDEAVTLDLSRIALSGSSAGGWIVFWLGLGMLPSLSPSFQDGIKAIAPIYPITTMSHPFFLEKQTPFMGRLEISSTEFEAFKDPNGPVVANTADIPMRNKLYMHAQQEALFPSLLFSTEQRESQGWLQRTDVVHFILSHSAAAASSQQRHKWAPVYMVHGVLDTAVDVDQARLAKEALEKVGHPVVLEEREDKDHLWDLLEPEENLEGYWDFLKRHLKL